ncbi:MAG TPA: permease [Xanthobacteraceae bacterium]|nr:permease [Xanthobacteraceae bacterium]
MTTEPPIKRRRNPFDWSTMAVGTLVAVCGLTVLLRDGRAHFFEVLEGDLGLLTGMLFKVLAGCLIGAFLTLLLPRQLVARWVGAESGAFGLVIGTIVGFILPGGPITIYPVASAFVAVGADLGVTVAFITSWTLLGYTRALVWELPFFGPDFVIWRIVVSLPLPFVAGLLTRLIVATLGPRLGFKQ